MVGERQKKMYYSRTSNKPELITSKKKIDELFFVWLSDPDVQSMVKELTVLGREGRLTPESTSAIVARASVQGRKEPPRSPNSRGSPNTSPKDQGKRHFNRLRSPLSSPTKKALNQVAQDLARAALQEAGNSPVAKRSNQEEEDPAARKGKGETGSPVAAPAPTPAPASPATPTMDRIAAPEAQAATTTPTPAIPAFYVPNEGGRGRGRRVPGDRFAEREEALKAAFADPAAVAAGGVGPDDFVTLTKEYCGLPSFLSLPLHNRVRLLWARRAPGGAAAPLPEEGVVTFDMFAWFWAHEVEPYDVTDRLFRLLKRPDANVIFPADFEIVLKELLAYHPGLEFLENTPEFQEKYARTVVARIFYSTDRTRSWQLRRRDVRQSTPSLLDTFILVDEEEDINQVHDIFSYEHFYVLYCKFWELDSDHDFFLSRDDLLRYGGHALTRRIVDRVFEQAGRPFLSDTPGKMAYEDFVFFMLSEEDKTNRDSVEYWFKCIDLDGDGEVHGYEMRSFYDEQLHRMECLGHEMVPFSNIMTQMMDIVCMPPGPAVFRMEHFCSQGSAHMGLTSVVFNMLFNLNKFIAYEQRDPFVMKQQRMEGSGMTTWGRFAVMEYARLAMEEEAREQDEY
jgi:serine/threonine-protein phosphatase 2A regulatory subunit B''